MQILSIHLKNIKSHRDTELSFSPGINVLSGPNGVGKSTVFEAIGYALFGVDASCFVGNIERFLTIGAKKGEVTVVFQVGNEERFRVTRTVGTPAKWLLSKEVGGTFEVEEHKGIEETEARLKELLGLNGGRSLSEQFELVIGPFQNEFLGPFVIRQASKRRDKFDEILGIDAWRKTYNETKSLASAIAAKIKELEAAIGPLQEQVAALPETVEAHRTSVAGLEQAELELLRLQQALVALTTRLAESDRREEALKALGVEIEKLQGRVELGKEKICGQRTLIDEAVKAGQLVAEHAAGKEAYEQAEKRLLKQREQDQLRQHLEKETASLDKQVGQLNERYAAEERAIEQARNDLHNAEQSLAGKRTTLAVDETLRKLAARLPELRMSINEVRAQAGKLEGKWAGLEEGHEKLAEGICPFFQEPCLNIAAKPPGDVFSGKFAELKAELLRLSAELSRLEAEERESIQANDQLKAVSGQLKELDEQARSLMTKGKMNDERAAGLIHLQKEQAEAQQQLVGRQQSLNVYARLPAEIVAAEVELKTHQAARDLYLANQEQAARMEERQTELKKFETLLAQLQQELTAKESDSKVTSKEYDADRHRALREQKDLLGKEAGALEEKLARFKADSKRLADEIDKLKKVEQDIADKQAHIKTYSEKEELVKFLRNRVFKQVSGYLSERFREEISLRANRIYRTIAESDEELAWGEDYRIVLRDMVDGTLRERSDDQLSGGQTMSAVVALRLAMLQTIGARIAFFDEPTSNLDAARRENLATAFRAIDVGKEEVTEHWYDQLFLISHDVAFTEVTDQILQLGE